MKRRALLIMNPGREGVNLVPSVPQVIGRYKNFLMSPVGGYWDEDEEILELDRLNREGDSLESDLVLKLTELNRPDVDYSLIVFIGHGGAANGTESIQLEDGEIIAIENFLVANGNPNPIKRTVVIDACRKFVPIEQRHLIEGQMDFSGRVFIDGMACREFYNHLIYETQPHIEVIQSTQYGQLAHGFNNGTAFTAALFDTIDFYNELWNNQAFMYRECYKSYYDIIEEVKKRMAEYNQVPQLSGLPEGTNPFPLYALKRTTKKV